MISKVYTPPFKMAGFCEHVAVFRIKGLKHVKCVVVYARGMIVKLTSTNSSNSTVIG